MLRSVQPLGRFYSSIEAYLGIGIEETNAGICIPSSIISVQYRTIKCLIALPDSRSGPVPTSDRSVVCHSVTAQSPLSLFPAHFPLSMYCPLPPRPLSAAAAHFLLSTALCPLSTALCPLFTAHCPQSTVRYPLPTVQRQLFTVHCPMPACCLLSTVCFLLPAVNCLLPTVECPLSLPTVRCPQSTSLPPLLAANCPLPDVGYV